MYELGYDLLLNEKEIQTEVEMLAKKAEVFEKGLNDLEEVLMEMQNSAIIEGDSAKNLAVFVEEIGMLKGEADRMKEEWKSKIVAYVTAVDMADRLLF